MPEDLVSIITDQTGILFKNLDETLNSIEESQLYDNQICDWPIGEQLFHLLRSLDQWFVNPNDYAESPLALKKRNLNGKITKNELIEYSSLIKNKVFAYLETLHSNELSDKPQDCQFSRLALILGQNRHLMYHLGIMHGCLRVYTGGQNPPYYGISRPIEPSEKQV